MSVSRFPAEEVFRVLTEIEDMFPDLQTITYGAPHIRRLKRAHVCFSAQDRTISSSADDDMPTTEPIKLSTHESLATFQRAWRTGAAILVPDAGNEFQLPWNPQYFSENYGTLRCYIEDCETAEVIISTAKDFFDAFDRPPKAQEQPSWKLKVRVVLVCGWTALHI